MIEIRGGKILQRQWRLRPLYMFEIDVEELPEDEWVTVFPTTSDCLVQFMAMRNYNANTARNGEIRVTCDGQTFLSEEESFIKEWRYFYLNPYNEELGTEGGYGGASAAPVTNLAAYLYPWVAQSMKIEARRTAYWPTTSYLQFRTRYWTL